jgi:hypothetical protein
MGCLTAVVLPGQHRCAAPQATNHLGRRSFFSTTNEAQWLNVRKGTAAAFCHQNIRWAVRRGSAG